MRWIACLAVAFAAAAFAPTAYAGIIRINTGGPAYTAQSGEKWLADSYFTGGGTGATTASIGRTTDPAIYQNERWGNFSYAIPVANGTYDVRFHFVELWYGSPCVGSRVFGMDVLDTASSPDLANIDVCAAVGPNRAYVRTVQNVTVTDGVLNIQSVYGSADDPELTGLEVVRRSP